MRLLSYPQLRSEKGVPYTRVHIARLEKDERFPRHVALSNKRIAWVETEIDQWIASFLAEREQKAA